jgi:hypothetical protein
MAHRIEWAFALFLCAACAGSKPAAEEPATPEVESPPAAEPSSDEPPAEPEETPPAAETAPEPTETKKKCEELDKSTCKVTVGCGWNDVKNCVSTAVSE